MTEFAAKMVQITQTTTEWAADATVVDEGVICVEKNDAGTELVGIKIGLGTGDFASLDYVADPNASGVTDGDKGDITVSASGATWTIDAGAVDATKVAADVATQAELDAVEAAKEDTLNAAGVVGKFTGTPDGTQFLKDDGTLAVPDGGASGEPSVIWIPADEMGPALAAPALTTLLNRRCYNLTTNQGLSRVLFPGADLPTSWTTLDVWLWVANTTTDTGNYTITLRSTGLQSGEGEVMPGMGGTNLVTTTAAAQYVLQRVQLWDGVAVDTAELLTLYFYRNPANDTKTGAISVLGIEIRSGNP